jgi:hypothetical protein
MSITITIPTTVGGMARLLVSAAEPCLLAAAALAGVGPLGQAVAVGVWRIGRQVDVALTVSAAS